jgi:hypothetical protein
MTGECKTCGFLSRRVRYNGIFRAHERFWEATPEDREKTQDNFRFVPGDTNAVQHGEFVCFRWAANLPEETGQTAGARGISRDDALRAVLDKDRRCPRWREYERGVDPSGHLQDEKEGLRENARRTFEQMLSGFEGRQNKRLTGLAILLALIIGLFQATPDALGIQLLCKIGSWLHWIDASAVCTDSRESGQRRDLVR